MRKRLFIFSLTVLLVTGCTEKTDQIIENSKDLEETAIKDLKEKEINKSLTVDSAKFHFVADWLTETKIVYVEKENGLYLMKTFDVESGQSAIVYEDSSMIIDILIHPSKKYYLLHTSDNSASAKIKIVRMDGTIHDEIIVASTELEIEWNDIDPSLILFTAFHEDWTFDSLLYNGENKSLELLAIEDPFPKWLGKDMIAVSHIEGHILDGGEIHTFEPATEKWGKLEVDDVVYFDTYEESLLIVTVNEELNAHFSIMNKDGLVRSEWMMPAISNYSEWVIPEIEWISKDTVLLPSHVEGGQLDELLSPYRLIRVTGGRQAVVADEIASGLLRCSPSGEKCLTGNSAENLIDVVSAVQTLWLKLTE